MQRQKILSNFIWRFAEQFSAQLVTLIVSIILARLLDPETYGIIALINVFLSIVQIFIDSGLGNALIQKKDADDIDFSSVFYINVLFSIGLYVLLFITAPVIANFYHDRSMILMIRVLSFSVVVAGIKNVQQAYISRHMMFKRFFYSTLGGTICAAIIGIMLAYNGYGVWALIVQKLVNVTVDTVLLWITVKWHPQKVFSLARLKTLFSYGWKIMASTILDIGYDKIRMLIIGRLYSPADLGIYEQGEKIPNQFVNCINTSIDSVLFPTMSAVQENKEYVKSMTRKAITVSSYIMWPMMIGLAVVAEPLIKLILTEKWIPCVPFLRIFCIAYAFWPIHTANLNAIKAMGRSDLFLKLEVIKATVGLTVTLATMWFGPLVMAYSMLVTNVISQIINASPNKELLEYRYVEQLKDIFPSMFLSVIMGVIVYSISLLSGDLIGTLVLQVLVGIAVYLSLSYFFKLEGFCYVLNFLKDFLEKGER